MLSKFQVQHCPYSQELDHGFVCPLSLSPAAQKLLHAYSADIKVNAPLEEALTDASSNLKKRKRVVEKGSRSDKTP